MPVPRPEIYLLYEAPPPEIDRNVTDFDLAAPLLDDEARDWLRRSLEVARPACDWIRRL